MRILIDIVHLADVLFFKRPIEMFRARGDELLVLSRIKDMTCELLDQFGYSHEPNSTATNSIFGLAVELIGRDHAVIRAAREIRPGVSIGFGGVHKSRERELPGVLEPLRYRSSLTMIHHLMAHCRLAVGEGA